MIIDKPVPDNGVGWFPMPNESAQDRTLSLRARGLLSLILSYRDGADLTVEKLATVLKESEDVISKARKELVSGGYIIHSRYAAKRGRWATETFAGNSPEVARAAAEQWQNKQNPSSRRVDGLPRVGGTEGSDSRVVGDTEGSVDRIAC